MSECNRCGDPLDGASRCPRCGAHNPQPPDPDSPIGGFPVLVEKRTAEHEVARFGSVTGPQSAVTARRPLSRWILITVTVGLLLMFLILTLMKDPLKIFRAEPPGQGRGGGIQAVGGVGAEGPDQEPPSLGPGATRLPSDQMELSIHHSDPEKVPPLSVQGLADGDPPVCWVPRDEDETLIIDAGFERSWSHLLLYRCSLPSAGVTPPRELTIEVRTPGQARSRLLHLRNEDAPNRVDLGGLLSDQLILTLRPARTAAGLSGVEGYHFEDKEQ
ncbi:MAG: hypothetical protein ABIK09_10525 [Pseudomonadota bacterium]